MRPNFEPAESAGGSSSDDLHRRVVEALQDGVYYVDRERRIEYWNQAAARITGFSPPDVVGRRCFDNILNHVDDAGNVLCVGRCPLAATIEDGLPRQALIYLRHHDGHRVPVDVHVSAIRDESGAIVGAAELFRDATPQRDQQPGIDELRRLAFADEVTGLPNRRQAERELAGRLDSLVRRGWPFGLLVADIDRFKQLNDGLGHLAGDAGLGVVARTIANASRTEDFVSRWGGDEFCIMVAGIDEAGLARAAERIRALVARSRLVVDGVEIPLSVSIGGTVAVPADTVATLFARADAALYSSKHSGRNRVSLWTPEDEDHPAQPRYLSAPDASD